MTIKMNYQYKNFYFTLDEKLKNLIRRKSTPNQDLIEYLYRQYDFGKRIKDGKKYLLLIIMHLFFAIDSNYKHYELIRILFEKIYIDNIIKIYEEINLLNICNIDKRRFAFICSKYIK